MLYDLGHRSYGCEVRVPSEGSISMLLHDTQQE
jgi:hypothetical protein